MARIARYSYQGDISYGLIGDDEMVSPIIGSIFGEWKTVAEKLDLASVKLLAPVDPPNILAIGLNYRAHAMESNMPMPERPALFIKANTAAIGPNDQIVLPKIAPNEVDYECELAMIIGKTAKNVSEAEALDYVLGYTCANDVSARDCQLKLDPQWARGKSFDTFAPLGPWVVTDIDPDNAPICTRLNGQVMQESNTNDLIFSCAQLISFLSHGLTLLPGTVIMTGTPSGVGFARDEPVFLRDGDTVEIEIEGIGILTNSVVAE